MRTDTAAANIETFRRLLQTYQLELSAQALEAAKMWFTENGQNGNQKLPDYLFQQTIDNYSVRIFRLEGSLTHEAFSLVIAGDINQVPAPKTSN